MGRVRCVHFADLHLGVETGGRTDPATGLNRRVVDVCERLDEVCACVEDEQVDLVLFAGDAFKHQHPTPTLQNLFAERIRRMARSGARVFLLIGNHDLPKMAALAHPFSIYAALEVEGVVVGDRAQVYRIPLGSRTDVDAVQVAALPHFSRQHVLSRLGEVGDPEQEIIRTITRTVRSLGSDVDPSLPSVFCGHCHVNQAEIGGGQAMFGVSEIEISKSTLVSGQPFPYYALGHIHRQQVLDTDPFVAYPGSLERVDFSEGERVTVAAAGGVERRGGEDKGFYRFDLTDDGRGWTLEAQPVFRTVAARPFVTVRAGALGTDDPTVVAIERLRLARDAGAGFDGAFVKVVVELDTADRGRLDHRRVRESVAEAYDVRLAVSVAEEMRVRDPRFARRMGEAEALARYLETHEDWSEDREALLRLGRELIDEVLA